MAYFITICALWSMLMQAGGDTQAGERTILKLYGPYDLILLLRSIDYDPKWKTFAEQELEFTPDQLKALNKEWRRIERQLFATQNELAKVLPSANPIIIDANLVAERIFGENTKELVREDQLLPLARFAFQHSFDIAIRSEEMRKYLSITDSQHEAIGLLTAGRINAKLPEDKRKLIKKCESTEGRIFLFLDGKQQKLVRELLGKPIPGSWLKEVDELKEENEKVLEAEEKKTN